MPLSKHRIRIIINKNFECNEDFCCPYVVPRNIMFLNKEFSRKQKKPSTHCESKAYKRVHPRGFEPLTA